MRPNWDETWMAVAEVIGRRSSCCRAQVGAVIVSDKNRIIATGYNNPPAGFPIGETCMAICPRSSKMTHTPSYDDCISIHAEANALLFCDRSQRLESTLYSTSSVCVECAKLVANSGVRRVVVKARDVSVLHRNPDDAIRSMRQCGLEVEEV